METGELPEYQKIKYADLYYVYFVISKPHRLGLPDVKSLKENQLLLIW